MKHPLILTLAGRDWYRLYLSYWIPALLLIALSYSLPFFFPSSMDDPSRTWRALGLQVVVLFMSLLVSAWFAMPIMQAWLSRLRVADQGFAFSGERNEYLMLNIRGFLLSVVTIGVYGPWYWGRMLDYQAEHTEFAGARARFVGRPGQLLLRILGCVGLVLVCSVVLTTTLILFAAPTPQRAAQAAQAANGQLVTTLITFAMFFCVLVPLVYLMYGWMFQFAWKETTIRWNTRFWPACLRILCQLLLTVVTLGLWWPVAFLKLYRYFVGKTIAEQNGRVVMTCSFEGKTGEGFLLLWGQALLSVITVGIYGAWAAPAVARWLARNTFVEAVSAS